MKIPKDQPFWTSVILHLVVLLALLIVTIVQAFKPKEKPHVFEMVDSANEVSQSQQVAPQPPVKKAPVKLPPVPTPRPKEKPPSEPQIIYYRDFNKEHPKDKPKPRPFETPRGIDVHQIYVPDPSPSRPSPQLLRQQMSALDDYSSRLRSRIDATWVKPTQLAGVRLVAEVVFDVSSSGRIANVRLRHGSGNAAFDQSILAAFRNASPAGPTPTGQSHQFSLSFQMGQ
jgi:protein TonB